jgi:hypothetical protein
VGLYSRNTPSPGGMQGNNFKDYLGEMKKKFNELNEHFDQRHSELFKPQD